MQQPYDEKRITGRMIRRTNIPTLIRQCYNWLLCWLSIKCKYDINASIARCIDFILFFEFNVSNIVRSSDMMIHPANTYMIIICCKHSYDTNYKLNAYKCITCKMHRWSSVFLFSCFYDRTIGWFILQIYKMIRYTNLASLKIWN